MAEVQLAELNTFVRAWRIECPWLVVCKSVNMFTRCRVCEYLRLLVDQTLRVEEALRGVLQARRGATTKFKALSVWQSFVWRSCVRRVTGRRGSC